MTHAYRRVSSVDVFESGDGRRLLVFGRRTGELMVLVDRSADLWRALAGAAPLDAGPDDRLVLESWRRRGFVEVAAETP
jgi:hypothetical protein